MELMKLNIKPQYFFDESGTPKSVLISKREYEEIEALLEDFEDTIDLLKAERDATSFKPYDEFRKQWLLK